MEFVVPSLVLEVVIPQDFSPAPDGELFSSLSDPLSLVSTTNLL